MTIALLVRRVLLGGAVALVLLAMLARAVRVPYASTAQTKWDRNTGEVYGNIEVGQTFESVRSHLAAVAFQIATYSGRANTEEVIFELRRSPTDAAVLRTVRVNAQAFGDHQWYRFIFAPLPDSRGQTYYASLRSPASRPGNAIAVDFSNFNPYQKHGPSHLFLLRSGRADALAVERSRKGAADIAFAVFHRVPLTERAWLIGRDILVALRENPAPLTLAARLAAVSALLTLLLFLPGRWFRWAVGRSIFPYLLGGVLIVGLLWRMLYARHLPFTNDEGTLWYDAWAVLQGRLPGGDGLLKTPAAIGVHVAGLKLLGTELLTGRVVSAVASLLTAAPLMVMASALGLSRRGALAVAALWSLAAAPAVFGVYLHAQPVQLLFGVTALALTSMALNGSPQRSRSVRRRLLLAALAGVSFGLALAARKTSLAFAFPALLLVVISPRPLRERAAVVATVAAGLIVVLLSATVLVNSLYGRGGVEYFLGIDVASIDPETTGSAEERRAAFIKGVLPFFREALPLILLSLIGLGGALEAVASRRAPRSFSRVLWLVPIAGAWFSRSFLTAYERSEHLVFGVLGFWAATIAVLVALALLPRRSVPDFGRESSSDARGWGRLLPVGLAWLVGVAVLYATWIKFTANYLSEFIPPLTLLAGLGVAWSWRALPRARVIVPALALVIFWGAVASARSAYVFPHTGTFDLGTLKDVANFLRRTVPPDKPILTAAVVLPVLSGHRVPYDVAHPTHYAYGFIEPEVRDIYLAPVGQLLDTIRRDVDWIVLERLTAFSYFREYPEIERMVETEFEEVATFDNLSNPITVLRRK